MKKKLTKALALSLLLMSSVTTFGAPAYTYNADTQTMTAKNYKFAEEKDVKFAKGKVIAKTIYGTSWAVHIQLNAKQELTCTLDSEDYEWLPYICRGAEIQLRINNTKDYLKSKGKVYKLQVTDRMRKGIDQDPNWGACMRDMPVEIEFASEKGLNLLKNYPGQTVKFDTCTIVSKLPETNTYIAKNIWGTKFIIKFRGTAQVRFKPGDKFGDSSHTGGVFIGEKTVNNKTYLYFQD